MKSFLCGAATALSLMSSFTVAAAEAQVEEVDLSKMKVDQVFAHLCATCHGAQLEGGQGGSLIDGEWKYGSSDADLFRSIAKGNLQLGMTPWEGVLTKDQIRALVILIREKEKEARVKGIDFPVPEPGKVTETERVRYSMEMVVPKDLEIP